MLAHVNSGDTYLCTAVCHPTAIIMLQARSAGIMSAVELQSPFIIRKTPFPI